VTTVIEALRGGIACLMADDPRVFVVGEDIRFGGTFGLTKGLVDRFGPRRILDAPIAEAGFVGLAVGAAMNGMRPIVDFQYGDFVLPAANMIIQEATKIPYFSGGQTSIPLVIHCPTGASGRGAQHANQIEQLFFGVPGLHIAVPSTPYDAKGALIAASHGSTPTLICAHKHLYGSTGRYLETGYGSVGEVPEGLYEIESGIATTRREGRDVTIVGALLMSHRALAAADLLQTAGIEAEVIDLRWLVPLDVASVLLSVRRTGALVVVEEGPATGGWASTVVAGVSEAEPGVPVRRVSGPDESIPSALHLELRHVPDAETIASAVRSLLAAGAIT